MCLAVLVAGALGNLDPRGHLDLSEQYRDPPESVQGQELIRARYDPPGRVAPLDVVTDTEVNIEVRDALRETAGRGRREHGLAVRRRRARLGGGPARRRPVLHARDGSGPAPARGGAARPAASSLALIGGPAAELYDNREALRADARLIVPVVLVLILLVLIALLRCVVAPLYVIGTVVLSFAFALGASSLIFTHVFDQPDSDPNLAIFAFIFLVALGVDDNIFLMSRIREEHRRGLATRDAVIAGLEKTGGVITVGRADPRRHVRGADGARTRGALPGRLHRVARAARATRFLVRDVSWCRRSRCCSARRNWWP